MSHPNRIHQTSLVTSVDRQTPNNAFGAVLARTMGSALHGGTAMVGGTIAGVPVASAAVSGVGGVVNGMLTAPSGLMATPTPVAGLPSAGAVITSASPQAPTSGAATLQALQGMSLDASAYLAIQKQMELESRQFNLATNVMKVRHDSAKAAINNIR
ncbi:MAG TPA: hypothetical protein VEY30_09200 [Myxococcaceae bacterium]|nr:hypothetical protein [Myxococcaceae bacterium]